MAKNNGNSSEKASRIPGVDRKGYYRRLLSRFILVTVFCSLVPLLIVGWGINIHYTRFARVRMIHALQNEIDHHRKVIELFLKKQSSKLQLIAHTHSKEDLSNPAKLNTVFELINQEGWSIADLGVIDHNGRHLAYIGPYDLLGKNYAQTFWFPRVMETGLYISDMFLGFRKEPHFVVAVTGSANGEKWILRATVDTEAFRSLVENVRIGETGEVYLLNQEGILQTSPRFSGNIMGKADFSMPALHEGIAIRIEEPHTGSGNKVQRQILSMAWLKEPRWLLVVKQNYKEAFNEVNHANQAVLIFLHLSAGTILIVAVLISRHMINVIRRRDHEADQLSRQLHQTSKLAAIGQLSAGVAHEINNPLAIILTEQQILKDAMSSDDPGDSRFLAQLEDSLSQIDVQIKRCKRITTNLLRFSRRTESVIESVHLNAFILEVIELMEREARSSGITFTPDLDEQLPPILCDPSQLQQVFLNMINNAIDAHEGKAYGSITIRTRFDDELMESDRRIYIYIVDTGNGIPQDLLDKIYDPFFTTKAVGKGTGLGLSISYSIVQRLGGEMDVESRSGQGTTFCIRLPQRPPQDPFAQMAGASGENDAIPASR